MSGFFIYYVSFFRASFYFYLLLAFTARFKMLGHFQIFVSALVFGVNIRFWYL